MNTALIPEPKAMTMEWLKTKQLGVPNAHTLIFDDQLDFIPDNLLSQALFVTDEMGRTALDVLEVCNRARFDGTVRYLALLASVQTNETPHQQEMRMARQEQLSRIARRPLTQLSLDPFEEQLRDTIELLLDKKEFKAAAGLLSTTELAGIRGDQMLWDEIPDEIIEELLYTAREGGWELPDRRNKVKRIRQSVSTEIQSELEDPEEAWPPIRVPEPPEPVGIEM
jgi:hypothetical protein